MKCVKSSVFLTQRNELTTVISWTTLVSSSTCMWFLSAQTFNSHWTYYMSLLFISPAPTHHFNLLIFIFSFRSLSTSSCSGIYNFDIKHLLLSLRLFILSCHLCSSVNETGIKKEKNKNQEGWPNHGLQKKVLNLSHLKTQNAVNCLKHAIADPTVGNQCLQFVIFEIAPTDTKIG